MTVIIIIHKISAQCCFCWQHNVPVCADWVCRSLRAPSPRCRLLRTPGFEMSQTSGKGAGWGKRRESGMRQEDEETERRKQSMKCYSISTWNKPGTSPVRKFLSNVFLIPKNTLHSLLDQIKSFKVEKSSNSKIILYFKIPLKVKANFITQSMLDFSSAWICDNHFDVSENLSLSEDGKEPSFPPHLPLPH